MTLQEQLSSSSQEVTRLKSADSDQEAASTQKIKLLEEIANLDQE